ncbi:hypothetical protein [Deinococcus multiflagellatus]|uniref:Uncharacterized protein n=1 Tax=Deinococcus multiflagellatus TaxID=1656887 RepID=A0ABW1ZKW7_9DEIO|nr:hypothetical protein [Deinococcus multiflagellatus]MBZ9713889.1 hypothetical protein [Deinococcus multiflagellatus]
MIRMLFLMALLAPTAVPPGIQEWAQDEQLTLQSARTTTQGDWSVFDGQYRALSGKVTVKLVSSRAGGDGTPYNRLRYDFVYPRDSAAAVTMVKTYAQQEAVEVLDSKRLNACLEAVQQAKAPQVKTMVWKMLNAQEGRFLKVNCGVTATSTYVTYEEKALSSTYWKK